VGANNRIKGRATQMDAGVVEVTGITTQGILAPMTMHAVAMGRIAVGDTVEAFVRPEVASIARDTTLFVKNGWPHFRGIVRSILFDGANSAVLLHEDASRIEFRIALPQTGQLANLSVGESVCFGFDPKRAVCFPADPQGGADAI
jgi:spermidine/putrescine transport system ATP-binding protein